MDNYFRHIHELTFVDSVLVEVGLCCSIEPWLALDAVSVDLKDFLVV
jgi:hypothetical protein